MTNIQFLFTLFCQVFFALGLNKCLEEGNIFYSFRRPFENLFTEIENKKNFDYPIFWLQVKYYIAKPIVLCITCFASVWGCSVFVALNGITDALLPYLIISCISASYIQTVIYVKTNI